MALNTSGKFGQFRSGSEREFYRQCRKMGYNPRFEHPDDIIEYIVPEEKRKYHCDFVFTKKNGEKMYVEFKGLWHLEDRKKHLYIKKNHPDKDIRFIFEKPNNKIKKSSSTTYGMWCDSKGFKWAGKKMPVAWLKEVIHDSTLPDAPISGHSLPPQEQAD